MDRMTITVLEDGTIRSSTDSVSGAAHQNAEDFLASIAEMVGGTTTRQARTDIQHQHHHHHGEEHSHA